MIFYTPCESCYFKNAGIMVDPCFWCCQDNCFGQKKDKWDAYLSDTMTDEEVEELFRKQKEEFDKLFGDEMREALKELKNER